MRGAEVHQLETIGAGRPPGAVRAAELLGIRQVHHDGQLPIGQAAVDERLALHGVHADDPARQFAADELFDREHRPQDPAPDTGELGRIGFDQRVVDVENDLPPEQPRQNRREDQEIRHVVNVNEIGRALQQRDRALEKRQHQEAHVRQEILESALAPVLRNVELFYLDAVEEIGARLGSFPEDQDRHAVRRERCDRLGLAPDAGIGRIRRIRDHADVSVHRAQGLGLRA